MSRRYKMHSRLNLWREDEVATLRAMAEDGASMGKVAAALGRTRNAVAGQAKKHGIKFKGKFSNSKPRTAQVIPFPKPRVAKPVKAKKPVLRVVNNIDLMVKDYLARNGARRFEEGFSTDYLNLKNYLQPRGVEINLKGSQLRVSRGHGRPQSCTYREVFAIADTFRIAEGLTPILRGGQ